MVGRSRTGVGERIEVVQRPYPPAVTKQPVGQVGAHEARASGDERNAHQIVQSVSSTASACAASTASTSFSRLSGRTDAADTAASGTMKSQIRSVSAFVKPSS